MERKLKSQHVIERLEKLELEIIFKACEIRKEVKSATDEEKKNHYI